MHDLLFGSTTSLANAIRNKRVSATEVVEAHIRRIEQVDPHLNAVIRTAFDSARVDARRADDAIAQGKVLGPLHGVPMTIKDSLDTAGVVTTGGTEGRSSFIPTSDATVVSRLREAGAILLGKTNTPELTLAFETDNDIYGRTNNPYDTSLSAGGSSGGAAAAIAVGTSPFDIGSDTGGSIRLPAHWCGITGIRPTSGRVSRIGHILPPGGFQDSLTQLGPMSRYVEDLEPLLRIISGPDQLDPTVAAFELKSASQVVASRLRLAVFVDNGIMPPDRETAAAVTAAANALSDHGIQVEEERPPGIEETSDLWGEISTIDGGAYIGSLLKRYGTRKPHRWTIAPDGDPFLKSAQREAPDTAGAAAVIERWDRFRATMLGFMEQRDVILCPACAFPAQPHNTWIDPDRILGFTYTATFNFTGWPAAVVRCGTTSSGLPIGVQIAARPFREDIVLAVAAILEQIFGGWQCPTQFA